MKAIGIGIIGCGNVLDAYLPQCERLESRGAARVHVACGRPAQRERALGLGARRFTTNENDVLHAPEVDLVLILTSMPSHARLTREALEAGKHVLVEKPFATTLEEADSLLQLATRKQRHLACAPFTTLSPTFRSIAQIIQSGRIGKPCSARARYGWAGPSWADWFYKPGGGCLFDLAVYCVTSLTGLLGPVHRVMAMTGAAIPRRMIEGRPTAVEAEDNAQVLLDFGDRCFGVVTSGFTMQQYRSPALEIYGTDGVVQMIGDDWDPDGHELWENRVGAWQVFKETAPDWSWTDGLPHTVQRLREDKTPEVNPRHARHVLEILLAAQRSGASGSAIDVISRFDRAPCAPLPGSDPAHLQHDRSRPHPPEH
ncbi:MAG: Gfo/Idh/MocA family oxidoreductase [Verrucomicrobia bacterium]|nr:Gfo/Idh/MocA family oxidoreductase [Verrucomicrobiota bacterium]